MKKIKRSNMLTSLLTACIFIPAIAVGDYIRTGPMIGEDCKGIGFAFESCAPRELVAVKRDGGLYEVATLIPEDGVDRYSAAKGMCWKTLRSESLGILSHAINAAFLQTYIYIDTDGRRTEIEPDLLKFRCQKR